MKDKDWSYSEIFELGIEVCAVIPDKVLTPADMSAPDLVILGKHETEDRLGDYMELYKVLLGKEFEPKTGDVEKRVINNLNNYGYNV